MQRPLYCNQSNENAIVTTITEMKTLTLQPNNSMIKQKLFQMINFTISSFGGLDASVLPANAASHITETQNLMSLRSLCYVTCC